MKAHQKRIDKKFKDMAVKKSKKEINRIVKKKEMQVKSGAVIRKPATRKHNGWTSPRS
jgi:hypothetical protein